MRRPPLHRYATRPGFFLTDDGGADAVIWSQNADRVWLSVIEEANAPSVFASLAFDYDHSHSAGVDIGDAPSPTKPEAFFAVASRYSVTTRVIGTYRETLFAMSGPNYGNWFVHLPHAWDGMRYGYRVDGPWDPRNGVRFNPYKFLIYPCAKGLSGNVVFSSALHAYASVTNSTSTLDSESNGAFGAPSTLDSLGDVPFSVVIDDRDSTKHDVESAHPHVPWASTVIYELHVKGFTKRAPWLPEELRGTYAGLADPHTIDYLTQLGITSVELLPIFAKCAEPHLSEQGKENYWGYSTLNYFSPEPSYATTRSQERGPQAVRQEVIDMVDALHAAGIEVILDVVYNHSCEGDETGYSLSWRGIDGHSYYRRDPRDGGRLLDSTGTGNTFDFSQTQVITMAVDSLRYWAKRIGVDGFRFDLAVSLARLGETPASHGAAQRHSANGRFTPHHPFLYAIRSDMLLGNLKLIMEPWDTGDNGWRTGQFGLPFSEWNDHFRDVTRQFWLTDAARLHSGKSAHLSMQELATRLCGSADLFATEPGRGAVASINYVCSHDGFTLADLTRYNSKHNDLNGENNHDGSDTNYSFNCGVEGPTANPDVILKRQRASLNMAGTTLLSLGTPMLVAGDEFGRTQDGNNNPYVQDNSISWLDWSWMQQDPLSWQRQRFSSITALISLRTQLEQFHHEAFFTVMSQLGLLTQSDRVQWYLPDGTSPTDADWRDSTRRSFSLRLRSKSVDALLTVNGTATPEDFSIPDDTQWRLLWSSQPLEYEARGAATSLASVRIPELTLSLWEQEQ